MTSQRGNAFVYILIAVVLFAGLTFAITSNMQNSADKEISEAQAKTAATQILAYASEAQNAINRMTMNGTEIDDIDFTMPSNASFNNAPTINKLFHPDGGGLQYKNLPVNSSNLTTTPANAYYVGKDNNFEWTPTASRDVLFTAFSLKKEVCQELNRKISGSPTVPKVASTNLRVYLVSSSYYGGVDLDMTAAACPDCAEKPALCISSSNENRYAFYSILIAR